MTLLFLFLKIMVVVFFLVMFLRGSKVIWGIGLLTVTTAMLLDTLLGTFGRDEMAAQLGFFFYVISGGLFAGTALWLWGLLRPATVTAGPAPSRAPRISVERHKATGEIVGTAYDRQMLYDQIRYRFGPDDVLDLIFDLGINENDVISFHQELNDLIIQVMDLAEERGQASNLALAVERILTPLPREHLPRLEKLNADSPHTVLRAFLIANYSLDQLEQMAAEMSVEWENIAGNSKKEKARNLLLYLYRRNQVEDLISLMQEPVAVG
ncbi:MAG: hypothetical protein L0332_05675 [Chloroflexi bacterium]|nr:hypothetical protein [Chloroflexota bacterium]MCI0575049.1 hypothetical protein [Chloroflexota bacterium]MCI0643575.1 hypothetical protein [Chloroflexota bacterium]MCI0726197.1 hypothetical protein [Chloroflexota bacterium]